MINTNDIYSQATTIINNLMRFKIILIVNYGYYVLFSIIYLKFILILKKSIPIFLRSQKLYLSHVIIFVFFIVKSLLFDYFPYKYTPISFKKAKYLSNCEVVI